ncbi:hypothetical protein P691DRAFT_807990 [Macrolepiota fuliginosa MF-IS2]|uniref:Fatty acid desaturase domain-containing protein n=1 Tax=Macrolepiota fuliginosa MF-IS2 TaxID=1400762 RepID=A0A9P5X3S4_9AGAR|nr:hypothetical protein P691DRAFT_807990 [Macrolepiota fuliginosa MF-IS2]
MSTTAPVETSLLETAPDAFTHFDASKTTTALKEAIAISNRHKGRDNVKAMFAIINNYITCFVCASLCEYMQRNYPNDRTLWWTVYTVAALIIASRLRAFENLVHEASHNNLFTLARMHDKLEFLFAFPVFRVLKIYRTQHIEHHKYIGDPALDADVARFIHYGLVSDRPLDSRRFWWLVYGLPFTGWLQYEYIVTTFAEFWMTPTSYPSKLLYWSAILAIVQHQNAWKGFGLYFVVPWMVILPVTRWWAEMSEHLGLNMTDHFGNSRTNDGFWQQWWIHPLNDGLHATHHLNSQVPFHRLRGAHEELMQKSTEYRTRNVFSHGLRETFLQILTRPTIVRSKAVHGVRAGWKNGHQFWAGN